MPDPLIRFRNLEKTFPLKGGLFHALWRIEFDVESGDFLSVMGPSGAGQIDTARDRVKVARMALDLATQNLTAEEKRLQNGVSSTFLVLDRQERLAQAQLDELSALVSHNDSVASFRRLAGRTDFDEIAQKLLEPVDQ